MATLTTPQGYGPETQTDASTLSIISATPSTVTSTYTTSSTTVRVTTSVATYSSSTTSSTQTTSASAPHFTYIQLDGDSIQPYDLSFVNQAPFGELCPGGDCYRACQDFSLLFNVESYVFAEDTSANVTSSDGRITLFGVCTNIKGLTDVVVNSPSTLENTVSYFSNKQEQAIADQIPANISMCLYDTCQATRDPAQCNDLCWPDDTEAAGTMDFNAVSKCMRQLCSNVCGLPYANQDVFGIGVLWSYGIQAAFIVAYTIWLMFLWLVRRAVEPNDRVRRVAQRLGCSSFLDSTSQIGTKRHRTANWLLAFGNRVNEAAVAFLAAECFFGASLAIAAIRQKPATIDPLNGYALLSVAITGFLPPIFTLMLLHSQSDRQWFLTVMVVFTWALSTGLFWALYDNLSSIDGSNERLAEARNSLFNVTTCGGYSAMSMCQENIHNDPLHYMMQFYNWNKFPGIQTVWLTWVLPTLVFIFLLVIRIVSFSKPRRGPTSFRHRNIMRTFWVTSTALLFFSFIYQLLMYLRYKQMEVIDKDNWTFGQVVALMVWAPVLLDLFFRPLLDRLQRVISKCWSLCR